MRMRIVALGVALVASLICAPAMASFKIGFSSVAGAVDLGSVISDGGGGDLAAATPGQITLVGASYAGWTFSITGTSSKPFIGSASAPAMSIAVQGVVSGAAPIYIWVTDTDFGTGVNPLGFDETINGALAANALTTMEVYSDTANAEFAKTSSFGPALSFTGTGTDSDTGSATTDAAYSITMLFKMNTSGSPQQWDASIQAVPEPATLAIWSVLGLVGSVFALRRRG